MTHGPLDLYCLECSEVIRWRKEDLIRDDGYYNWRVVASCGCGEISDQEILASARAACDEATKDDVFNMQEAAMEKALGPELHAALASTLDHDEKDRLQTL